MQLYAIDCGRIRVSNMSAFSDTGELDGKPATVVDSCFLIRHPNGTLLWDTGLSDKLAENKGGVESGIFKLSVTKGLIDQLKTIDITPSDVTHLAFSHLHFDHTGNANAFASATWIINKDEVAWAEATPTPSGVDPSSFDVGKIATTRTIDGDYERTRSLQSIASRRSSRTPRHDSSCSTMSRTSLPCRSFRRSWSNVEGQRQRPPS